MRKSYQSDWLLLLLFTPLPVTLFFVVSISRPALHCWKKWIQYKKYNVTVQYLHSYESKSIKNRLRRWDFDLYVSGFWHVHAKTPRGIVDC